MRYLLDTSVCVRVLRGEVASVRRLAALRPEDTVLPAMTIAELRYGAMRAKLTRAAHTRLDAFLTVFDVVAFDADAAEHHARIRHALASNGLMIGERDLVIAATAAAHGFTVATGNLREFQRVPGLVVEAWE
jgi:tRNA(fMet)-specific endonuclease VapC